jgi:peptidoglycan-associated lipoprotein
LALLVVIPGLFFTASCAKKTVKTDASMTEAGQEEAKAEAAVEKKVEQAKQKEDAGQKELERQRELARQQALEEERLRDQRRREMALAERKRQAENDRQLAEIQMKIFLGELVLFNYDSSVLTPEAQERLTKKAQWLQKNSGAKIIIEGHCDERGSVEYNLALGERRAEAAKSFLVDMGISASRLTTISYGKERPFVKGNYESAWSLNRRAHFVIE